MRQYRQLLTGSALRLSNWQLYCNDAAAVGSYSTKMVVNEQIDNIKMSLAMLTSASVHKRRHNIDNNLQLLV